MKATGIGGRTSIKYKEIVRRLLLSGPVNTVEIKRALSLDPIGKMGERVVGSLLQQLREAGLIENVSRYHSTWQIAPGVKICPHCEGRGMWKEIDDD